MREIKDIVLIIFIILGISEINAQEYRVQIAAFAKQVPFTHFLFSGVNNVYSHVDQDEVYRYYLNKRFLSVEEAVLAQEKLIEKGFNNAQIIDIGYEKALCEKNDPAAKQGVIYTNINTEYLYLKKIYYNSGEYRLSKDDKATLNAVHKLLKNNKDYKLKILGHTDAVGSAKDNLKLSEKRARTVRNYLVNKGIEVDCISIKVFGESTPVAINLNSHGKDVPKGRYFNRRVVLAVTDGSGEIVMDKMRTKDVPGHLRVNKQTLRQQLMFVDLKN